MVFDILPPVPSEQGGFMDEILDEEAGGGSGAGRTANPLPGCLRRKGAQPGGSGAGHRGRDTHRRGRSGQGLGGPGVGGWLLGSAHGTRRG